MGESFFNFNQEQLNNLFPFYLLLDNQLRIESYGRSLDKIFTVELNQAFYAHFRLKRPNFSSSTFSDLAALTGQLVILSTQSQEELVFRGQFEFFQEEQKLIFLGSPWFGSMEQVREKKLTLHDFAVHDPMIDLLHVLKTQEMATEEIKELLLTVNKQKKTLEGINEFAKSLLGQVTPDEIAWAIIDTAISRFDLEDCIVYMMDEHEEYLLQRAAYGHKQIKKREILDPIRIKVGEGIVGKVALTGQASVIADTTKVPEYIVDDMIRYSELTVPIIADNKVIGVIDSEHSSRNFFTDEHLSTFSTLANFASTKIKNALSLEKNIAMEKALKESQARFKMIVENASEIIYETNAQGRYTYANPVFFEKMGYSFEELKQMHFLELVKESQRKRVGDFYRQEIINKRLKTYYELTAITKEGKEIWVGQNVHYQFNADGSLKGAMIVARDITDSKKYEQTLKIQEEKYRNIIANMKLGLIEVNHNDVIQFANQSFSDMSGYEIEELIGKKAADLLLTERTKNIIENKNSMRKKGITDMYELPVRNKQGEERWWLVSGAPNYDAEGSSTGSIGIHLDFTRQKKLEDELSAAKQKSFLGL